MGGYFAFFSTNSSCSCSQSSNDRPPCVLPTPVYYPIFSLAPSGKADSIKRLAPWGHSICSTHLTGTRFNLWTERVKRTLLCLPGSDKGLFATKFCYRSFKGDTFVLLSKREKFGLCQSIQPHYCYFLSSTRLRQSLLAFVPVNVLVRVLPCTRTKQLKLSLSSHFVQINYFSPQFLLVLACSFLVSNQQHVLGKKNKQQHDRIHAAQLCRLDGEDMLSVRLLQSEPRTLHLRH